MDPVRTMIMNNRFTAIVEEASSILHRTAHTTFVKLIQDFQCALATVDGDIFAYPAQTGVAAFIGLPLTGIVDKFDKRQLKPGDCIITNDPFATDGAVTHLMDVTIVRPIFCNGDLIAFGWSFIHATDIGGGVPGSISPAFTEVFQEGIRLRPMKLFREGVLNEDVRNILLDNSRAPDELWGDMQAMLSALKSMDRRMNQLCERYGLDAVRSGIVDVLDFAEEKARAVFASIPDGTYSFRDYMEGLQPGQYTHIKATMRVDKGEVHLDFDGTDPQVPAAYNFVSGARTNPYLVLALVFYLRTMDPTAPRNAGFLRTIKAKTQRGTIVNAEFPAAGGSRVASGGRVYDAILGCLNQAVPGALVAAGSGMSGIIVVNARDPLTGKRRVTVVNPISGGGGGRRQHDGIDGVDGRFGTLRSVPAEIIELETVMLLRQYQMLADTQAAGERQSGPAVIMEFENTGAEATMTVRGMNRFQFRPWGVRGGEAGRLGRVILNPDTAAKDIGKINVLQLKRGDVVRLLSPAGGGFGDPLQRDPALVERDVRAGLVSRTRALGVYGVALDTHGKVDGNATAAERLQRPRPAGAAPAFSLGAEREAYDRIWPDAVRSALAREAMKQEPSVRHLLLSRVRDRLTEEGRPVDPALLERTMAEELSALGGAPAPSSAERRARSGRNT